MKKLILVAALATVPGLAIAGKTGAGPVGIGSSTSGAVALSPAASNAMFDTPSEEGQFEFDPSTAGAITLQAGQIQSVAAILLGSGGTQTGTIIKAPTTLAGDAPGTIILDTESGQLIVAEGTI